MLIRLRHKAERGTGSARWRLFFWLFALLAGFEAPFSASEASGGRATTGLSAHAPDSMPGQYPVALSVTDPQELANWPPGGQTLFVDGSNGDEPTAAGLTHPRSGLTAHPDERVVDFQIIRSAAAFSSRAPPPFA